MHYVNVPGWNLTLSDFIELRYIFSVILNRWWLLVICVAAAAASGYFFSQSQQPIYRATARMAIASTLEANALKYSDVEAITQQIRTYADLGIRQPILEAVVVNIPLNESWQQLQDRVRITPVTTSQMLEISVDATSREEAILIANEIARELLRVNLENDQRDERLAKVTFAQTRIVESEKKIEIIQTELNELREIQTNGMMPNMFKSRWISWLNPGNAANLADPASEVSLRLKEEIALAERELLEWEKSYNRWELIVQTNATYRYIDIVESAQVSQTPVRPQTQLNVIVFGGIGFAFALGLIALLEQLNRSIKVTDDFVQRLQLPVIGTIRSVRDGSYINRLSLRRERALDISEDYWNLANKLQLLYPQTPKTLLIASPYGGEGRSTVVAHLGVILAQSGYKTIIIDADWQQPIQHELFQVPNNNQGLLQLLSSRTLGLTTPLWTIPQFPNLHVITCGTLATQHVPSDQADISVNPVQKLHSHRMRQLLAYLSEQADVIIIDTPPMLESPVAVTLASQVTGVILMAEMNQTTWDALLDTKLALQRASANVLGLVLNRTAAKIATQSPQVSLAVLRNDHTGTIPKVVPVDKPTDRPEIFTNGVNQAAQINPALSQRSERMVVAKHLTKSHVNARQATMPVPIEAASTAGGFNEVTFEEAGIEALLLNSVQESVTIKLPDTVQWVFEHGDQLQLEILAWQDECSIDSNGHLPYAAIAVVLDGVALGAVPLEHNGPQAAIVSIPAHFDADQQTVPHTLQISLQNNGADIKQRGLTVVIRPSSVLRHTTKSVALTIG